MSTDDFNFEVPDFSGIDFTFDDAPVNDAPVNDAPVEDVEDNEPEVIDLVKPVAEMSEAEVLSEFDALINSDPDIIAAKASIIEAEAILEQVEKDRAAKEHRYNELVERKQELTQALAEVNRELTTLQQFHRELKATEREAEQRKEHEAKAIELAKEAIRVRMESREKIAAYDDIAKDCAWFTGITFPDGSTHRIFDQQYVGAKFLATAERCILADGMGTGKSLQSIAALDLSQAKRILIVCQADITSNFNEEIRRWGRKRAVTNMRGMPKDQRNSMLSMLNDFSEEFCVILNFEAWRKDLSLIERLISMGFDTVIIDEAHNIKEGSVDKWGKVTGTAAFRGLKDICHRVNLCPKDKTILPAPIINGKVAQGVARICPTCGWSGESYDIEMDKPMTWQEVETAKFYAVRTVKRVWCLTGTPILNKPQDLFTMLHLIDPLNFSDKRDFLDRYCMQDMYSGRWTFGAGGLEMITRKLRGRYLSRTMKDMGITLPEQRPIIHDLDFDREGYPLQAEVIDQVTNSAEIVMNSGKSLPLIHQIQIMLRQRQANVWPGGITWKVEDENGIEQIYKVSEEIQESMKIDFAIQLIKEAVDRGERIVLFSQFKTALDEMQSRLNGARTEDDNVIRSVVFSGSTDENTRQQIKRNFDAKHGEEIKWDVALVNYKTGGTGLNFTAATRTVILDEEWNPGKRDQAYARTHRIGQTKTTFVDIIRINRTIDTWMAKLIDEKEDMIGGFADNSRDVQASWLDAFQKGEFRA